MSAPDKPLDQYPQADLAAFPNPPPAPQDSAPPPSTPKNAQEIAALQFLDPYFRAQKIPLKYGFVLDGAPIVEIVARPIGVAEVGLVARGDYDAFDLFAIMTGLPAPVLRALQYEDGARLYDVCSPFLPHFLRDDDIAATPDAGDDTPSSSRAP